MSASKNKENKGEKILKEIVAAPSIALEATIDTSEWMLKKVSDKNYIRRAKHYWETLGPGLVTGAADDDPSGIATYSQTGAQFGYGLLWLAAFSFPLMTMVQEMCARIGLVTGRGLAGNIRLFFPKWVLYLCTILLFLANTLNIGADLGAMAKAVQLLQPTANFPVVLLVFTTLSLGLQIFIPYAKYAKYLKWLALILVSYIFAVLAIPNLDWGVILKSAFIPTFNFTREKILMICAILGTTISPYLFFWQTSQEVEEEILEGKTNLKLRQEETSKEEIKEMRIDVVSGMFLSNLVMFFIIAACSATLFQSGITNIATVADAANALRPFAGDSAYLLFALGIIGTGMLAVPVLAGSAAYALAESFRWKQGLYRKLKDASAFYGVIIFSTVLGLLINFIGLDPIKVLIYSAIGNGLVAPIVLILIVIISSNKKIMGDHVNGKLLKVCGWICVGVMCLVGLLTIFTLFAK